MPDAKEGNMKRTAIVVVIATALTLANGAQAATTKGKQEPNLFKRFLVWAQGKLILPLPSPEPTSTSSDQLRQGS